MVKVVKHPAGKESTPFAADDGKGVKKVALRKRASAGKASSKRAGSGEAVAGATSGLAEAYLTKRILNTAARKAFAQAAVRGMHVMGHVMVADNGWIVKKYKDGRVERIKKINTAPPLRLD